MSEIKAGVTLMQDFCVSQSDEFQSYIDYMDREEAQRNQAFQTYSLFHDYMDNPEKSTGLFTDKIDRVDLKQKRELKELFQKAQENGSNMWQTVISFDNRWLEKNGIMDTQTNFIDEAQIRRAARYGINKMLQAEGLELATWCASFHYNTDNIHIHVATVEPYPTRQVIEWNGRKEYKGKFKLKSLEQCKSCVVNEILHTREINQKLNQTIRKDIVEAKKRNRMIDDPEMRKGFLKLYEEVTKIPKGVRNYNNGTMAKLHWEIDKLSLRYMEKYHPKELEEFKEMVTQQSNLYAEAYGKYDMSYMEGKTQDLYTRLGNAILKEVKWYETQISKRIEREEISSKEKEEMKEEKKEQVKDDAFPGKRMVPEEPEKEKVAEEKTEDQRYATAKSLLKWGEEEDVKKGIRYLTELASEGHEAARVKLGCEFLKGEHVPRNVEMAREYLIKAAEQGNEFSKGMLIQLSETGRAGSKRYAMADLDWALYKMQKSMEQEHVHTYKILRQYELEQDMEFDREYSL